MIKHWWQYAICYAVILVSVFCTINLITLFNVKSAEYGSAIVISKNQNFKEVSKFDDTRLIDFTSDDYINFQSISTFAHEDFDGQNRDYLITLNNQPANDVVSTAGRVSGVIMLNFYNLEGKKITTATLNITIEYFASNTIVTISIRNQKDCMSYLTTYAEINGFVIRVVERS